MEHSRKHAVGRLVPQQDKHHVASWQAHLIVPILKWKVKRKLRASTDVAVVRNVFGSVVPKVAPTVVAEPACVGGVPGEWSRPRNGKSAATMLYLHGGGYVGCSPQTHRQVTGAFASSGFDVFAPAYRLAPEHPFPAALDDAFATYRALLAYGVAPDHIVIAGDSAGGGLALALMLRCRERDVPRPVAAALFSPWTDLACTGTSIDRNARRCALLSRQSVVRGATTYLAGASPTNPLASPLYGDFTGLPRMLIHVGADEVLLDDSTRVAARAEAVDVLCTLKVWPVVPHGWQILPFLPEARASLAEAASFLHDASTETN
jgi:monoterpene epsilon-lactone hydrolase